MTPHPMYDVVTPPVDWQPLPPGVADWHPDRLLTHALDRFGERVAIVEGARTVTYAELDDLVARAASSLRRRCTGSRRVVSRLPNGVDAAVAFLAALRGGLGVTLLTSADRGPRFDAIAARLDVDLAIVDRAESAGAGAGAEHTISWPTASLHELLEAPARLHDAVDGEGRLVFTSGSTGRPKGIVQTQRGVVAHAVEMVAWMKLAGSDVALSLAPMGYGGTTTTMLGAFLVGGSISFVRLVDNGLAGLTEAVRRDGVTVFRSTPSVIRALANDDTEPLVATDVRIVTVGGDSVRPTDFGAIWQVFGPTTVAANQFSASEVGLVSRRVDVAATGHDPGRPWGGIGDRGRHLLVIDDAAQPVPAGAEGALLVATEPDLRYPLDDTEADAYRTIGGVEFYATGDLAAVHADGTIEHRGRVSNRLKLDGNAIDAVEIESALRSDPAVQDAMVAVDERKTSSELVAVVVPARGRQVDDEALRRRVATTLPDFCVPGRIAIAARLPSANGKVDRRACVELVSSRATDTVTGRERPSDWLEMRLLTEWESIFERSPISVTAPFFSIGGTSTLAYELVERIRRGIGIDLSPAVVLSAPTIRGQAEAIRNETGLRGEALVAMRPSGELAPVIFFHGGRGGVVYGREMLDHLDPDRPAHAFQIDDPTRASTRRTLGAMATDVTERLAEADLGESPVFIGYSFGGALAWEAARVRVAGGAPLTAVIAIDTSLAPSRWRRFPPRFAGWLADADRRGGRRIRYLRGLAAARVKRGERPPPPSRAPRDLLPIARVCSGARATWEPSVVDVPLLIVSAEGEIESHRRHWGPVAGGRFEIEEFAGADHYSLVRPPVHAAVGARIERFLADLDHRSAR